MVGPHHRSETSGLLLMIFLIHLILSSWGMQSIFNAPTSYLYTNTIFLLSLMFAINSNSTLESIAMALFINFTLLNLEIVTFTIYWPRVPWQGDYLGFAITNSTLRPFTCFLLYRIYVDLDENEIGLSGFLYNSARYTVSISLRACNGARFNGIGGGGGGSVGVGRRYRDYENIDNNIRTPSGTTIIPNNPNVNQKYVPLSAQQQIQFNSSQDEITIRTEQLRRPESNDDDTDDVLF